MICCTTNPHILWVNNPTDVKSCFVCTNVFSKIRYWMCSKTTDNIESLAENHLRVIPGHNLVNLYEYKSKPFLTIAWQCHSPLATLDVLRMLKGLLITFLRLSMFSWVLLDFGVSFDFLFPKLPGFETELHVSGHWRNVHSPQDYCKIDHRIHLKPFEHKISNSLYFLIIVEWSGTRAAQSSQQKYLKYLV